jgi:hypothetical protein
MLDMRAGVTNTNAWYGGESYVQLFVRKGTVSFRSKRSTTYDTVRYTHSHSGVTDRRTNQSRVLMNVFRVIRYVSYLELYLQTAVLTVRTYCTRTLQNIMEKNTTPCDESRVTSHERVVVLQPYDGQTIL